MLLKHYGKRPEGSKTRVARYQQGGLVQAPDERNQQSQPQPQTQAQRADAQMAQTPRPDSLALGSGLAERARQFLRGRRQAIDDAVDKAVK